MGKTNYTQLGPFVYGDARFLAGGGTKCSTSYENDVATCETPVTPTSNPNTSSSIEMTRLGQYIAQGKTGYHGCRSSNCFVSVGDLRMPTVGVEIETILREYSADAAKDFRTHICSNWFHAENDGSLDNAHGGTYGYELVTAVLPARLYRDLEVWTGFQNLVSPYCRSYDSSETGLHVHVGMQYFFNTKLPRLCQDFVLIFGKLITSRLYYGLLPRSFVKRVFLRGDQHYCHESSHPRAIKPMQAMDGYALIDELMYELLSAAPGLESTLQDDAKSKMNSRSTGCVTCMLTSVNGRMSTDGLGLGGGHASEVNTWPKNTLEFRRGKGTINALSIHRMIELCVLLTTYAGHVIDNPAEEVSQAALMKFIIENTSSAALKGLAEKEVAKCA